MSDIKVSVVIAAWNAADFIAPAIRSALDQTLRAIEVIVVDDASSDATLDAARAAGAGDHRLRIISAERNGGPAAARNLGFSQARGDWIAVLDSDDAMEPGRLETLSFEGERERADIIVDDMLKVADLDRPEEGEPFLALDVVIPRRMGFADYVLSNVIFRGNTQTGYLKPLFRRSFLERHGLAYDESVRIGEDFLFVAGALAQGGRFVIHPSRGYRYLVRPGSISRRMTPEHAADLRRGFQDIVGDAGAVLAPSDRRAAARYLGALADAEAFLRMLDAAKARRFLELGHCALQRPLSLRHWRMPLQARLHRFMTATGSA